MAMDHKTLLDYTEEHYLIRLSKKVTQEEMERVEQGQNIFLAENYDLEAKPRSCEHCSKSVKGQKMTYALKRYVHRVNPHWEIKCNRCDLKYTANNIHKNIKK